jgi:arsenate reductase (glutaredoxin)
MRPTHSGTAGEGTCYRRRNDDCGTSFRNRDNDGPQQSYRGRQGPIEVIDSTVERSSEMKATIYHNPKCGTSRKTLEILRDSGCDVWIHEYLKNPPTRDELRRLYDRAGISPREGLRSKEPLATELGLARADVTDDEVLDAMVAHPILIERPIVETTNGVRLCRPQEAVREIL